LIAAAPIAALIVEESDLSRAIWLGGVLVLLVVAFADLYASPGERRLEGRR
jgi:hypothetical protein